MAKRMGGCFLGFILGVVFVFVAVAGGLFLGANYAVNRFLGDEGQWMRLGIKNVFQLVDFVNAVNKPDMSGIIRGESKPGEGPKASALGKIESFGFPVDPVTGELEIEKILAGDITLDILATAFEIDVTGAEFASLINMALDSGAQGSFNLNDMRLEQIDLAYISQSECDVTITLSLSLDLVSGMLGPLSGFISAEKIYLTCVNTMTIANDGTQDKMSSSPKGGGGIQINNLGEKQSKQLFTAFLTMSGSEASTPEAYGESLGKIIADAINNFEGQKSFVEHAEDEPSNPPAIRLIWSL